MGLVFLLVKRYHLEMNKNKKEVWLNLGCGVSLADNFINVDNFFTLEDLKEGQKKKDGMFKNARVTKDSVFIKADICALPFEDNYADYIECSDTIEHQPMKDVLTALKEMYRVLKPGGKLGLGTTNFDELARLWTLNVTGNLLSTQGDWERYTKLSQVIYGNQAGLGYGEFHKSAFNPPTIAYYLQNAGFKLNDIVINIFPTNSPNLPPQKAYAHHRKNMTDTVVLTEMMFVTAIK